MANGRDDSDIHYSKPIQGFEALETGTVAIYRTLYDRIFWDLEHAHDQLCGPEMDFADLIHSAAHLRLVIEQVTMASFVASHTLVAQANVAVSNCRNFDSARKILQRLNPHYWPASFGQVTYGDRQGLGVRSGVGLQEAEIGRYFGLLSEVLHAQTPYVIKKRRRPPEEYMSEYRTLEEKLSILLESHIVQMADQAEYLYLTRNGQDIRTRAFSTDRALLD